MHSAATVAALAGSCVSFHITVRMVITACRGDYVIYQRYWDTKSEVILLICPHQFPFSLGDRLAAASFGRCTDGVSLHVHACECTWLSRALYNHERMLVWMRSCYFSNRDIATCNTLKWWNFLMLVSFFIDVAKKYVQSYVRTLMQPFPLATSWVKLQSAEVMRTWAIERSGANLVCPTGEGRLYSFSLLLLIHIGWPGDLSLWPRLQSIFTRARATTLSYSSPAECSTCH